MGLSFLSTVSGKSDSSRKRRSTSHSGLTDRNVDFEVYQCYWANCFVPYTPSEGAVVEATPDNAIFWDLASSWEDTEEGWGGNYGGGEYGPPLEGDDVKIPEGTDVSNTNDDCGAEGGIKLHSTNQSVNEFQ